MASSERTVALIFPPVPHYSRTLAEGVIDQQSGSRRWQLIDLPHLKVGRSPLPFHRDALDGAIVWADRRDRWIERLAEEGVKVVNCGSDWIGVANVASVCADRKIVAQALVEHIESVGLKHLLLIGHLLGKRPGMERLLGELARHAGSRGIEAVVWSLEGNNNPEDAPRRLLEADKEHRLRALLASIPKPAAIFCENDHIGVVVCRVARLAGLRIPEDLAVVGYGDNLIAQFSDPPLTSIAPPGREIGRAAATLLSRWFGKETIPKDVVIGKPTMAVRESTIGRSGSAGMERVRRFIAKNECRSVSLVTLADVAGVSVKTLIRNYTSAFGIGPLEDMRGRRLERAKTALENPSISISSVAEDAGFSSQANFYNYFLRHLGMSPSSYRDSRVK